MKYFSVLLLRLFYFYGLQAQFNWLKTRSLPSSIPSLFQWTKVSSHEIERAKRSERRDAKSTITYSITGCCFHFIITAFLYSQFNLVFTISLVRGPIIGSHKDLTFVVDPCTPASHRQISAFVAPCRSRLQQHRH